MAELQKDGRYEWVRGDNSNGEATNAGLGGAVAAWLSAFSELICTREAQKPTDWRNDKAVEKLRNGCMVQQNGPKTPGQIAHPVCQQ